MAHPIVHAKSSVRKFGGKVEDYIAIHLYIWIRFCIFNMYKT